jgi:hypothetical protein
VLDSHQLALGLAERREGRCRGAGCGPDRSKDPATARSFAGRRRSASANRRCRSRTSGSSTAPAPRRRGHVQVKALPRGDAGLRSITSDNRPRAGWDLPARVARARILSLHRIGGSNGSRGHRGGCAATARSTARAEDAWAHNSDLKPSRPRRASGERTLAQPTVTDGRSPAVVHRRSQGCGTRQRGMRFRRTTRSRRDRPVLPAWLRESPPMDCA